MIPTCCTNNFLSQLISFLFLNALQIKEPYIISHLLGAGPYGQVWFAFNFQAQEYDAVKIHGQHPSLNLNLTLASNMLLSLNVSQEKSNTKHRPSKTEWCPFLIVLCLMIDATLSIATVLEYCPSCKQRTFDSNSNCSEENEWYGSLLTTIWSLQICIW